MISPTNKSILGKTNKVRIIVLILLFVSAILLLIYFRLIQNHQIVTSVVAFPLELKWQIELGNFTYERPAYQQGLILLPASSLTNYWYGIDAKTGQVVWSQEIASYTYLRCLTMKYLVMSGYSTLVTLKIQTGEIVWRGERAGAASCNEEQVFFRGVPRDSISTFDLSTGQAIWQGTTPRKSFGGLIYNPGTKEVIAHETNVPGDLYFIDSQTGVVRQPFHKETFQIPDDDAAPGRGPIFLIDQDDLFLGGTVLDARTGTLIHKEEHYSSTSPMVTPDTMYLSAYQVGVVAFDRTDYTVKWIYQPQPSDPLNPLGPIAIWGGVGYVIFSDYTLRAFNLITGQEIGYWRPAINDASLWPICFSPPFYCKERSRAGLATSDNMLFASFGDGKLYAFGR